MAGKTRSVTLIHNETAGDANHNRSDIEKLIKRAGYHVRAVSIKNGNLDRVLDKPTDLIAVAGGDGAITKIAGKARTDGSPLAILPLGTANNIAATLGTGSSLEAIVGSWQTAKLRPFYRFEVEGPWGRSCVVEGIGFGCIEQVMDEIAPSKPSLRQAQARIAQIDFDVAPRETRCVSWLRNAFRRFRSHRDHQHPIRWPAFALSARSRPITAPNTRQLSRGSRGQTAQIFKVAFAWQYGRPGASNLAVCAMRHDPRTSPACTNK